MAESGALGLIARLGLARGRRLWLLSALTVVNAMFDLVLVAASMAFLAALAGTEVKGWTLDIGTAALLFGASALLANAGRLASLRLAERFTADVTHELTVEVQRRVFAQPYDYHARHHTSEILASLDKVQTVAFNLVRTWLQGLAALVTGIGVLALLVSIDPLPAVLAFAAMSLLYLGIGRLAARRLAANSRALGEAYGARIRKVQEGLGAIRDLIIDHAEQAEVADFRRIDARFAAAGASTRVIASAPRFVIEAGAVLLACALAVGFAKSEHVLLLIGGIAVGGLRILPLLQAAYAGWVQMAANQAVTADVVRLLELPLPAERPLPSPMPFEHCIRVSDLEFRFAARPPSVLGDVSLEIRRGQCVALVGETGSGKSTLADLIMGLLTPTSGSIAIDDVALDPRNVRSWQRNIAHVAQNVFLIDASIARNIGFSAPGGEPDMNRVRQAAAKAEIAGFIESLPDAYETRVGERGARLSGGQRQRIAIARALYKDAPLLVLDEATNALDEETEARVLANLFADERRTILIIAHRPSTLRRCDQIIRLQDGRIA